MIQTESPSSPTKKVATSASLWEERLYKKGWHRSSQNKRLFGEV